MTFQEIGDRLGVSKQRAAQLVKGRRPPVSSPRARKVIADALALIKELLNRYR